MNQDSVFHLLSDMTNEQGVSCVMIGGFAVNYYRVSRQTADVDFLITKEDFKKISALLEQAGYKNEILQDNFAQLKSTQLSLMDVDFMFVEEQTLSKIIAQSQQIEIAQQKFLVPSLNHLIALKLHSIKFNEKQRLNRDLPDIINLIRVNELDVKSEDFKELCLRFGTQELYQALLKEFK